MTFFPDDRTLLMIGNFRIPTYLVAAIFASIVVFIFLLKENKKHGYKRIVASYSYTVLLVDLSLAVYSGY